MLKIINNNLISEINDNSNTKRGIGLGVFDGYHRGHQELVRTLLSRSEELNIKASIYTFTKHPAFVAGNITKIAMGMISSENERIELLKKAGVDEILCQEFTSQFANVTPLEFLEKYLFEELNASLIVVGFNYLFGRNREGTVEFLKSWAKTRGVEVIVIEPVIFNGNYISSSIIRKSISKGHFEVANAMLGRNYSLTGIVIPGQKIGTKLGFPTANFYAEKSSCLPDNGVYATRLTVDGETLEAVTNIGLRPSAPVSVDSPIIETMALNKNIDLYGKEITVTFLHHLRKENKFDSLDALKTQIQKDIENIRDWHNKNEQCWEMLKVLDIPVYGIKSNRFTTDIIDITIKVPLTQINASRYALLSRILTSTCKQFPSRPLLSKYLDSLYGASIDTNIEALGDILVIHFTADALHTWRGQTSPINDTMALLFDILNSPDTNDKGKFSSEIFESERNNLIMELIARENDKTKYAYDKCGDFLTAGTIQNTRSSGDISVLKKIKMKDIIEAYNELLTSGNVSIFVAGKITSEFRQILDEQIRKTFALNKSMNHLYPGLKPQTLIPLPKNEIHKEIKDIEQAKVCIAYKGLMPYFSGQSGAVAILNSMLGGDVHSLLFDVVREKLGLAYSVFSFPMRYLSSVMLVAGVAHENVEVAIDAMKEQVRRLAENEYQDNLFDSAIESVSYSYRALSDDLHSMVHYYSSAMISGRNVSISDALIFVKNFDRQSISDIAKKLETSVVYVLTNDKNVSEKQ